MQWALLAFFVWKLWVSSSALLLFLVLDLILFDILFRGYFQPELNIWNRLIGVVKFTVLSGVMLDQWIDWMPFNGYESSRGVEGVLFLTVLVKMIFARLVFIESTRLNTQKSLKELQFLDYSSDFNNYFSHYINTPLTTAISNIEIAKFKLRKLLTPEQLDSVVANFDVITTGMDTVSKTASDLAHIHYLRSEVLREYQEPWYPIEYLKAIAKNLGVDAEVLVSENLKTEVPQVMLEQVLGEMIINAKVYGTDEARLRLVLNQDQNLLVVSVFNMGNIPSFNVNILNPFQRGHNTKEGSGTGLGLSLVNDLMSEYGCDFQLVNVGPLTKAELKVPIQKEGFFTSVQNPNVTSVNPMRTTNVTSFQSGPSY
jgi:signal transduction histidine kinase